MMGGGSSNRRLRIILLTVVAAASMTVSSFSFSDNNFKAFVGGGLPRSSALFSTSSTSYPKLAEMTRSEDGTFLVLSDSSKKITLIGTAHLSESSNLLVQETILKERPDSVLIEFDRARLPRLGLEILQDKLEGIPVADVEDIAVPLLPDDLEAFKDGWIVPLDVWVRDLFLDGVTAVFRRLLTNMYDDLGREMGGLKGGGEFLAAVEAAREIETCRRLVLGDRDSLQTIRRAWELALRSGDPLKVLADLNDVSKGEMDALEAGVRSDLGKEADESAIRVEVVERMKSDVDMRTRLFRRLEEEVPSMNRAFLTERDYIMAEAIRRELQVEGVENVVAVVGAGHVPGIAKNLCMDA